MSDAPVLLDQCERLHAVPHVECTRFSRFVLLKPKARRSEGGGASGPTPAVVATLPTDYRFRDARWAARLTRDAARHLRELRVRFPVVGPDPGPARGGKPGAGGRKVRVAGLGEVVLRGEKLDPEQRLAAMKVLFPSGFAPGQGQLQVRSSSPFGRKLDLDGMLAPILDAVRQFARLATEAQSQAVWAIGLDFRQCWHSQGYLRGRLVRSLPLTPGEQVEIVVKTWDKRSERKSAVEAVARQLSTEITGEEKWMLATKMLFGDQATASVNPSAGVNGDLSIPVETITATLGGNLGLAGNFANQLNQSAESGTEYIQSTTVKAAQSLSATRTNSVELSHEVGEEVARKQVIANTNRCHTLTYHYFEILERFRVETRFTGLRLYLLVPLPLPEVTREWVLCHECYLRMVLPCETYYAGFAAARTLLAWEKLGALYPPATYVPAAGQAGGAGSNTSGGGYTSPFAAAVEDLLERWAVLRNAELLSLGVNEGGDDLLDALAAGGQAIADGLGALAEGAAGAVQDGLDKAGEAVDEGLAIVGGALQDAGSAAGGLLGSLFSMAPQMQALGSPGGNVRRGGAGTWLYREVSAIAAPQIQQAFALLETAWPQTQSLPASQRGLAEFNLLLTFFAKLGMPAATFGKVDALFAGAAAAAVAAGGLGGAAAGAVIGGVAGAAIAVWGFGASAIPGAAIGAVVGGGVGGAVGAGAVASVLGLLAVLEAAGLADTVPDDEGLKDAAVRLKALLDASMALAPATGLPGAATGGEDADSASLAVEQWRERMAELAEAQVEFGRLACHLQEHLQAYMQGLWGQWPDHQVLAEVRRHGIPEDVVLPRFAGFHGHLGALPVVDLEWVREEGGLDWDELAEGMAERAEAQARTEEITLPTAGMTVEPALGQCDACEPFIEDHRLLDLENRRAEVDLQIARARQETLEADRFEMRIADNQLDDPTPFEGASVSVDVENP